MSVTKKNKKKNKHKAKPGAGLAGIRGDADRAVYFVSVPGAVESAVCVFTGFADVETL